LDAARVSFGDDFGAVLATCRIWVNGEQADGATAVGEYDEVAILPPVSGG
jgi:molybdopterin converting factor small subunit